MVSGFEKLLSPYQNFMYVIESYDFLHNSMLEEILARVMPWFELVLGVFLMLGFWLKPVLLGVACLILGFIGVVAQALIRGLSLSECGCFGSLISFPLPVVLALDTVLFVMIIILWRNMDRSRYFSLDKYFS